MGETAESIRAAFEAARFWNEGATILVVIGVGIELIALLLFSSHTPPRERASLFVGTLLVVIGVGGEVVFARRASDAADELQRRADVEIAIANAKAASAERDARQALEKTASRNVPIDCEDPKYGPSLNGYPNAHVEVLFAQEGADTHKLATMLQICLSEKGLRALDVAKPLPTAKSRQWPYVPPATAAGAPFEGVTVVGPPYAGNWAVHPCNWLEPGTVAFDAFRLVGAWMKHNVWSGCSSEVRPGSVRIVVGPRP